MQQLVARLRLDKERALKVSDMKAIKNQVNKKCRIAQPVKCTNRTNERTREPVQQLVARLRLDKERALKVSAMKAIKN